MNNTHNFDPRKWAKPEETEYQVRDLASLIISRGIDITKGYDNWLNLGFSLADGLGENGRSIYHDLSRMNGDYNSRDCDRQYNACLRDHGRGITIKTFFQMAKEAGIDLSQFHREHSSPTTQPPTCAINANVPFGTNMGNMGNNGVMEDFDKIVPDGTMAQLTQTGKTFCDKIQYDDWPEFLLPVLDSQNDTVGQDKMMISTLNIMSGILPSSYYTYYDRRKAYTPLFNIIVGGYATSKGELEACKELIKPIKAELRKKYDEEMEVYNQQMAEWEAQGKGKDKSQRGPAPKEPVLCNPFIPANSTTPAIYRALDGNGGWGLMREAELDTMSNMLSNKEYGDFTDLLRKVHHHETCSMRRVTEHIDIELEYPRMSALFSCTGSQIPLLFQGNNISNGLASRFLFYILPPSKIEFRDVFANNDKPLAEIYQEMSQQVHALYHALKEREGHPIQFCMSKAQQEEFVETFQCVLEEQFSMLGDGIVGFIFRIALECYRYAMVLTILRRSSERYQRQNTMFDDDEQALVCDERDFRIAMTIIDCLVNHTARVYSIIGQSDKDPFHNAPQQPPLAVKDFYQALPAEFSTQEGVEIAKQMNIPERTAKRYIGDFCTKYLTLDRKKQGQYAKVGTALQADV